MPGGSLGTRLILIIERQLRQPVETGAVTRLVIAVVGRVVDLDGQRDRNQFPCLVVGVSFPYQRFDRTLPERSGFPSSARH